MPKKTCPHQFCYVSPEERRKEGGKTEEQVINEVVGKYKGKWWVSQMTKALEIDREINRQYEQVNVFQCALCGERREHR